MGARYWVGGAAAWNATVGLKWALTSGGPGGAPAPTLADDVFFDANSGNVHVSVFGAPSCRNFDCTGFVGTIDLNNTGLNFYGSFTLGAAMTFSPSDAIVTGKATAPGQVVTTNGTTFDLGSSGVLVFDGAGGGWAFADDIDLAAGALSLVTGSLDDGGVDVTLRRFQSTLNGVRALTLGAGTWTFPDSSAANVWNVSGNNFTLLADPANTLKISISSPTLSKKFIGGAGYGYGNVWITGTHGLSFADVGNANISFNDLKVDAGNAVAFQAGAVFNLNTFTPGGGSGTEVILQSGTPGTQYTLNKLGGGTISVDYLNVTDCNGTPAATWWVGHNSIDGGNNTGLAFADVFNVSRAEAVAAAATSTALQASNASSAETGVAIDVPSATSVQLAAIAEVAAAAEASSGVKVTSAAIVEAGVAAESEDALITQDVVVAETIVPADASSANAIFEVAAAEVVVAFDSPSASASFEGAVAEAALAAETQAAAAAFAASTAETGVAAATQAATSGQVAAQAEAAEALDSPSAALVTQVAVAEQGLAVDVTSVAKATPVAAVEQLAVQDSTNASSVLVGTVTEAGGAVEAQSALAAFSAARAETVVAADASTAMDVLGGSVSEQVAATAAQSATANTVASVTEQQYAYDTPSANSILLASRGETAVAQDSPSATLRPPIGTAVSRVEQYNRASSRTQPL